MNGRTRKHILLVDDNEHLLVTLSDFLRFKDYDVTTARNGREALAILARVEPDLVLLDIMMPGIDGGDVAQIIQSNPRFARLPIIYLTAAATKQEVHAHGGVLGGNPAIAKPVDFDELVARIAQYLPKGPAPAGGGTGGEAP
jgi:CheY-like chemotaxis protein